MMKKCKICGKEFIPMHANEKFCSAVCREISLKNYAKTWRKNNKDYSTIYMRGYREKQKIEKFEKEKTGKA